MWAIAQTSPGGADVLRLMQVPKPAAKGRDVLVKNLAVATNPVDWKVRSGGGGATEESPRIVGWDASGIVEDAGEDVTTFKKGDHVWYAGGVHRNGCNAEFTLVDERIVGLKPKSWSFEDAAALPLTTLTAWEALELQMGLSLAPEEGPSSNVNVHLLIINAAGGVGSIAIQLAKNAFKVGSVTGTASRNETIDFIRSLGATDVVNHREPLAPQISALTHPITHVLICHDPDYYWPQIVDLIEPFGRIVSILPPQKALDWGKAFGKSLVFGVELMFTKPQTVAIDYAPTQSTVLSRAAHLADLGLIRTTRTGDVKELSVETLRAAHDTQQGLIAMGKQVLKVPDGGLKK
ncbi:hypothetical protein HDU93_009079 [Gonapodya sp. JEL0774]|nr:hypothetical protein HDU93_009079 [Gonapodya sp. JEL0774]